MKKILFSAALGAGMVLASALPAMAADPCVNSTTGALSRNICLKVRAKLALFSVNNLGETRQVDNTNVNTGGNLADMNTMDEGQGVDSGGAVALVDQASLLNDNIVDVDQCCTDEPVGEGGGSGNSITGYDSFNLALSADVKAVAFRINNTGRISQVSNTNVNTGGNSASMNTVGGSVTTGDANVSVYQLSSLNTNNITISQ